MMLLLYHDYHHFSFVAEGFCSSSKNMWEGITVLWGCVKCRTVGYKCAMRRTNLLICVS